MKEELSTAKKEAVRWSNKYHDLWYDVKPYLDALHRAPELVRGFLEKILAPKQEHTMNVPQKKPKKSLYRDFFFREIILKKKKKKKKHHPGSQEQTPPLFFLSPSWLCFKNRGGQPGRRGGGGRRGAPPSFCFCREKQQGPPRKGNALPYIDVSHRGVSSWAHLLFFCP